MQNSNEEDFKIKYFKYKAKYLELKDLLEGGVPTPAEEIKAETDCKAIKDKKECININKPGCEIAGAFTSGKCKFNKQAYEDIKYPGLGRLKSKCIEKKEKCSEISKKYCLEDVKECKFSIKDVEKDGAEKEQIEYETCKKIVINDPSKDCLNKTIPKCCLEEPLCQRDTAVKSKFICKKRVIPPTAEEKKKAAEEIIINDAKSTLSLQQLVYCLEAEFKAKKVSEKKVSEKNV